MKDDPIALAEAHFLTQSMLDKGIEHGDPLDDIADDIFWLFLRMELAKISDNNPDSPAIREAKVEALLYRVADNPTYHIRNLRNH